MAQFIVNFSFFLGVSGIEPRRLVSAPQNVDGVKLKLLQSIIPNPGLKTLPPFGSLPVCLPYLPESPSLAESPSKRNSKAASSQFKPDFFNRNSALLTSLPPLHTPAIVFYASLPFVVLFAITLFSTSFDWFSSAYAFLSVYDCFESCLRRFNCPFCHPKSENFEEKKCKFVVHDGPGHFGAQSGQNWLH